jgi:hypothetical protein
MLFGAVHFAIDPVHDEACASNGALNGDEK